MTNKTPAKNSPSKSKIGSKERDDFIVEPANINEIRRIALDRTTMRRDRALFARLMAGENLSIEISPSAETASFNPKTRRLILPLWAGVSDDVNDMLTAHEVGHALYSPSGNTVKDAINYIDPQNPKAAMQYWNIIEDARIERKMKEKYPGLNGIFARAYGEMEKFDIFGITKDPDIEKKLTTIDRLNLYHKLEIHTGRDSNFQNQTEKDFCKEMMEADTFEQSLHLAKRVYDYARMQNQAMPQSSDLDREMMKEDQESQNGKSGNSSNASQQPSKNIEDCKPEAGSAASRFDAENGVGTEEIREISGSGEGSNEGDGSGEGESQGEASKSQGQGQSQGQGEGDQNTQNSSNQAGTGLQGNGNGPVAPAPLGLTTEKIADALRQIKAIAGLEMVYMTVPKTINLDEIVVPYTQVLKDWENTNIPGGYLDNFIRDFNNLHRKKIGIMAQEFEMHKAADELSRTRIEEAGTLNTRRLHAYKYSEDIFRKNEVVKKGKSHGFVMIIDWSGSMDSILGNTIEQVLNLVQFCRRVRIPYEVYAFTSAYTNNNKQSTSQNPVKSRPDEIRVDYHHLIQFLSDEMSATEFETGRKILTTLCETAKRNETFTKNLQKSGFKGTPVGYGLGGTPLNASILSSTFVIEKFRRRTGTQIVNYLCLTDGEDTSGCTRNDGKYTRDGILVVRDLVTGQQFACPSDVLSNARGNTGLMVRINKGRTGCNALGYYLTDAKPEQAPGVLKTLGNLDGNDLNELAKSFKNNYFAEIKGAAGWDSYFVIPGNIDTGESQLKADANGSFAASFGQSLQNSRRSRVLLNRFVQMITKENIADDRFEATRRS